MVVLLSVWLSGCTLLPSPPTAEPVIEPRLPPDPQPLPPPVQEPAPTIAEPGPAPAEPVQPALTEPPRIAVLLSARSAAYEAVANAIAEQFEAVEVYDLADKSLTPREVFERVQSGETNVIVAIGLRATSFAQTFEDVPVVFSQVFNTGGIDLERENVKGVAVLPPLELQLKAWMELNPNLSSIGAIVGEGHERLLDEAARAAAASDVRFQHRVALSDRETLYLFTRLVPDIDGFWLFPDNRVLSATILRQMLRYATRHRVQVAVFNDALLSLGATISVTSVEDDIANTVIDVAQKLIEGVAQPAVTPLTKIRVRTTRRGVEQLVSDSRESTEDVH